MKFESIFLSMLFVACSTVCVLVIGAMLIAGPSSPSLVQTNHAVPTVAVHADCATSAAPYVCGAPEA